MVLNAFLVEDKADIRRTLVESMEELIPIRFIGQKVDEKSATQWLVANADRWDLAILDLCLESGSGFNLLRQCQLRSTRQRVVVLTSCRLSGVVERCIKFGADRVFDKLEEVEKLVNYSLEHYEYCNMLAELALEASEG